VSAGLYKLKEQFENPEVEALLRAEAEARGQQFFLNDGSLLPISVGFVQETTRFREFGPLSGSTFRVDLELAPKIGGSSLSRRTVDADFRKYLRVAGTLVLATRVRGFKSGGDNPGIFYFGGNMELRGYPYLSFAGSEGFFANAELRFPVIDLARTPIGIIGPLRGTIYAGVAGSRFKGQPFQFSTREAGVSYVNFDPNDPSTYFGEPVDAGLRLVDGRASYGIGMQLFFLGYPLHFDWTKLTDLKVTSKTRFDFWIGFDF
jgi:outer membrane protein assembly factor BamA